MDWTCQKKTSQLPLSFPDGLSFAKMLTAKLVSVCRASTRFNNFFKLYQITKKHNVEFSARREYLCAWSSQEARPPWLAWGPLKANLTVWKASTKKIMVICNIFQPFKIKGSAISFLLLVALPWREWPRTVFIAGFDCLTISILPSTVTGFAAAQWTT